MTECVCVCVCAHARLLRSDNSFFNFIGFIEFYSIPLKRWQPYTLLHLSQCAWYAIYFLDRVMLVSSLPFECSTKIYFIVIFVIQFRRLERARDAIDDFGDNVFLFFLLKKKSIGHLLETLIIEKL